MSVWEVLFNSVYRWTVERLSREFYQYNPNRLCTQYVAELLRETNSVPAVPQISEELRYQAKHY